MSRKKILNKEHNKLTYIDSIYSGSYFGNIEYIWLCESKTKYIQYNNNLKEIDIFINLDEILNKYDILWISNKSIYSYNYINLTNVIDQYKGNYLLLSNSSNADIFPFKDSWKLFKWNNNFEVQAIITSNNEVLYIICEFKESNNGNFYILNFTEQTNVEITDKYWNCNLTLEYNFNEWKISYLNASKNKTGTQWMTIGLSFLDNITNKVFLTDESYHKCDKNRIYTKTLRILQGKPFYYERFGFIYPDSIKIRTYVNGLRLKDILPGIQDNINLVKYFNQLKNNECAKIYEIVAKLEKDTKYKELFEQINIDVVRYNFNKTIIDIINSYL